MSFDPDAYLAGKSSVTDDKTTEKFDPDAYLAGIEDSARQIPWIAG